MDRGAGDRGVSEVIGFILVFAFLVVAFTVYQGLVVPEQNRQVEFQHNQDVQGDLQDLRNAILTSTSTGTGQSVSIEMGAAYPTRAIAQNLGVSAGSVRTEEVGTVRIDNARALDPETRDYLDGGTRVFETKSVRYRPVYSFYSTAPDTVYENTLVFNRFDGENITLTDQVLVDGRRITLVAVDGSLDATRQGTLSVSPDAISASSNRVSVRNTTDERVNVTVPTHLPASAWREILEDEMGPEGYVDDVEPAGGETVTIVLRQGVAYDLRMAKVGVGTGTVEEGPKYVTAVEGNRTSVPEGGRQKLVVEVRDRFNNPVSDVAVSNDTAPENGTIAPTDSTTGSDGRARFTYRAEDDVDGFQIDAVDVAFDGDGTANETVTLEVDVLDSDGSG